jgi:hypothetical protein
MLTSKANLNKEINKVKAENSELLTCRQFTPNFSTIFVGSVIIRVSQEAYPAEFRSPEICQEILRVNCLLIMF